MYESGNALKKYNKSVNKHDQTHTHTRGPARALADLLGHRWMYYNNKPFSRLAQHNQQRANLRGNTQADPIYLRCSPHPASRALVPSSMVPSPEHTPAPRRCARSRSYPSACAFLSQDSHLGTPCPRCRRVVDRPRAWIARRRNRPAGPFSGSLSGHLRGGCRALPAHAAASSSSERQLASTHCQLRPTALLGLSCRTNEHASTFKFCSRGKSS